jgi:hypothetical protein
MNTAKSGQGYPFSYAWVRFLQPRRGYPTVAVGARDCLKSRNISQIVARSHHHVPGLIVVHVGCGERSEPQRSRKASTDAVPAGHLILRWPSGISVPIRNNLPRGSHRGTMFVYSRILRQFLTPGATIGPPFQGAESLVPARN